MTNLCPACLSQTRIPFCNLKLTALLRYDHPLFLGIQQNVQSKRVLCGLLFFSWVSSSVGREVPNFWSQYVSHTLQRGLCARHTSSMWPGSLQLCLPLGRPQRPSPKHHDHILALACRHSASPLHPLHHQVGSVSLPRQTLPSQLSFALWRTCCWPCWPVQAHTSATIAAESLGQVFPRHRLFALGKL